MKYVLFYESADDVASRAAEYFPAHRALIDEYHARGALLMVGPFANPREGAMGVFTTREDAEGFAAADPFVGNGLVRAWYVREWMEVLAGP